jgi:hypothetical protein
MVLTAAAGGMSAYGQYQQGRAAAAVGRNNQIMSEYAAQDALRRGEQEALAVRRRGEAIKSSQRVSLAARGLDLGYGTPADLQEQTDFFTESDIATTRSNAQREAWSARYRGQMAAAQGRAERGAATLGAAGTLLGTAGKVANQWYTFNPPTDKAKV